VNINELRELLAAAESPRPWDMWDTGERFGKPGIAFHIGVDDSVPDPLPGQPDETCVTDELRPTVDMDSQGAVKPGNGKLIVAAVNALPELLDAFESALGLIAFCAEDYNSPRFTDRHGTGPRLTAFLRKHRG